MTRLQRLLLRLAERLADAWREGPEPPRRLAAEIRSFRNHFPRATADQWEDFAVRLVGTTYRDAFVRGREWDERNWPGPDPAASIEGPEDWGPESILPVVDSGITPEQERLVEELRRSGYPIEFRR